MYRNSPIGAAALLPPMKTKKKVEQGKGTAGHLLPLGHLLISSYNFISTVYRLFFTQVQILKQPWIVY